MKILKIDEDCTDNGCGLRTTIYVSGCWHGCKGCHNPSSWNKDNGIDMSIDEIMDVIISNKWSNVTISGGDPLTHQYKDTLLLLKEIKAKTNKNVWMYTGYTYEQLWLNGKYDALQYIDVLVDGKFVLAEKDLSILWRGSRNQRLIDVQKTLTNGEIIEWNVANLD